MPIWPREPEDDRAMSVLILLDTLTPAERRDLGNALLRAAWSAALEGTRILLLGLILKGEGRDHFGDAVSLGESRVPGEPTLVSGRCTGRRKRGRAVPR